MFVHCEHTCLRSTLACATCERLCCCLARALLSELTERCKDEIARFGQLLKWIHRFEPIFIMLPIERVLKMFWFSEEFRNQMVFPLVALFFGTGNQTPNVAAAVIARVFLDPDLRLFKFSPTRLLDSVPEMFAFPVLQVWLCMCSKVKTPKRAVLSLLYLHSVLGSFQDIFTTISDKSDYTLHCSRPIKRVVRQVDGHILAEDGAGAVEEFHEIIYTCDAETVGAAHVAIPAAASMQRPRDAGAVVASFRAYYLRNKPFCNLHSPASRSCAVQ